jgi:hypothetical protein
VTHLHALSASADRLRALVTPLDDAALEQGAYPSEWTIADVLSHLGSGAVIQQRRLDDALAGRPTPDDIGPPVWDEWNAKSPRAKADDGLRADRALVDRIAAVTAGPGTTGPDLVLPAEAYARLVYGRLDAEHTPAFEGDPSALELLRRVFPGP